MTRLFQSNDVRYGLLGYRRDLGVSLGVIWCDDGNICHYVENKPFFNRRLNMCFGFQQTLRRMCYLTIKEMANISEDVIIVTSR